MQWRIADFVFCSSTQTLTQGQQQYQLEPMAVELLAYFCQHPDRLISRDELIEQVWNGRIVTDNAVSRLITKLRKALQDDPRQPRCIATFPKKGYKFIAQVSQLDDAPLEAADTLTTKGDAAGSTGRHLRWFAGMAALVLVVGLIAWLGFPAKQPTFNSAKALTSEAGTNLFPDVSPDGTRLLFMSNKGGQIHQYLERLSDNRQLEIHQDGMGVGPARWSDDGSRIVYLAANQKSCRYYVRTVEGMTLGKPRLVHNCPAGSFGMVSFTHHNDEIIFAERSGDTPYSLFSLNINNGEPKRLNQPELVLGGNSRFDLHPTKNQLLISSPDEQQWEGFYRLDLDSDVLSLLFKLDSYICCGIWSQDGDRVVLMGEHPARELLSYDLTGRDKQLLYRGSQQIMGPFRHRNGKDYLFTASQDYLNAQLFNTQTGDTSVLLDSTTDDKLATFANTGGRLAFVSQRSGSEEIWLMNLADRQTSKLTDYHDGRHYVDLLWSPDDSTLAALTLNELHLIDAKSGRTTLIRMPQAEIRGVSFKSNKLLSFSRKEGKRWQLYEYQMDKGELTKGPEQWQFVRYRPQAEDTLWLDRHDRLYAGQTPKAVTDKVLTGDLMLYGRRFNLLKQGDQWYWSSNFPHYKGMRYSKGQGSPKTIFQSNAAGFDVKQQQIVFSLEVPGKANIYQTRDDQ
ncbi:winged helix-turn-helix domain-containing protein [Gallaecimonas kandeliae]|uniref:winged helix-turn-helix domain-containing protein n=1 Tax=Gallaecimonas kandeliae TaxID=3029055 RepID=UPI002647B811|nr:winged helix-turn-helix domain-containing protein [Gallaecimonas kandeliae]WKE65382.1 winged helix-turn-helix domain-containing protein [Gallaecimonas kandeliae]